MVCCGYFFNHSHQKNHSQAVLSGVETSTFRQKETESITASDTLSK